MTQETQDSKAQTTRSTPVLAIVATIAILLVIVGYMLFATGRSSGVFQMNRAPATPAAQPAGPAPTLHPGAMQDVPPGFVRSEGGGRFDLAGVQFLIIHFGPQWSGVDQNHFMTPTGDQPENQPGVSDLQATWRVSGGQFDCHQTLRRTSADAFSYDAVLTSEAGVQTSLLCMEIHLPVNQYAGEQLVVDGAAVKLPETFSTQGVFDSPSFKKVEIATSAGRLVIEGSGPLWIQDNRQYNATSFTVRLPLNPHNGLLTKTELHLTMKVLP